MADAVSPASMLRATTLNKLEDGADGLRFKGLLPGECEQALRERLGAPCSAHRVVGCAVQPRHIFGSRNSPLS
jgi:hypothetical protein